MSDSFPENLPINKFLLGDNLSLLQKIPDKSVRLVYIDPPFNTGKRQVKTTLKTDAVTSADEVGYRKGYNDKQYNQEIISQMSYEDSFFDYIEFLRPRLEQIHRVLTDDGSLFFHIDWRESSRCRMLLEEVFGGPQHCINEIIWAYDFGARSKKKWATKHDNIYWFAKNPDNYVFNYEAQDRVPYMAPGLVGLEKATKGKVPTDVWWHTIVATNGKEKTGYPTQKPIDILKWIIAVHTHQGDTVLDCFSGSGTTAAAALQLRRNFIAMDKSKAAQKVVKQRIMQPRKQQESPQQHMLAKNINHMILEQKNQFRADRESAWFASDYAWIWEVPAINRAKICKKIILNLLEQVTNKKTKIDLSIPLNNANTDYKSSMLIDEKYFLFDNLSDAKKHYALLGITPANLYFWLLPQSELKSLLKQSKQDFLLLNLESHLDFDKFGGKIDDDFFTAAVTS